MPAGAVWRIVAAVAAVALFSLAAFLLFTRRNSPPEPAVTGEVTSRALKLERQVVGASVQGRAIEAHTYGGGATRLLLIGGIHGGYEWNSVVLAYGGMDYLAMSPAAIPANVSVTVVPNANPDGIFKVVGKEGRFAASDVPVGTDQSPGRFNANAVDLNRNFDCRWQPQATWKDSPVSAGSAAFSEPEARAVRDLVLKIGPAAVVLWHSQANAVYASACEAGILPVTLEVMDAYAIASGYPAVKTFDAYAVTGAAEDWLASIGVPAITVELSTHEAVELERNLAGVKALFERYGQNTKPAP